MPTRYLLIGLLILLPVACARSGDRGSELAESAGLVQSGTTLPASTTSSASEPAATAPLSSLGASTTIPAATEPASAATSTTALINGEPIAEPFDQTFTRIEELTGSTSYRFTSTFRSIHEEGEEELIIHGEVAAPDTYSLSGADGAVISIGDRYWERIDGKWHESEPHWERGPLEPPQNYREAADVLEGLAAGGEFIRNETLADGTATAHWRFEREGEEPDGQPYRNWVDAWIDRRGVLMRSEYGVAYIGDDFALIYSWEIRDIGADIVVDPPSSASEETEEAPEEDQDTEYGDPIVNGSLPAMPEAVSADTSSTGLAAPTVIGQDFDGSEVVIASDGTAKAILFVAHWCRHCQAEIPRVQTWLNETGGVQGVDIYSVSTSASSGRSNFPASEWLASEGWTVPVIRDDKDNTVVQTFGGVGYPFWVFVNADGKVALRTSGELSIADLETVLTAVLEK